MIKYNQNGDVIWETALESNSSIAREIRIALDSDNNIIVTEFSRTLKLDRNTEILFGYNNTIQAIVGTNVSLLILMETYI